MEDRTEVGVVVPLELEVDMVAWALEQTSLEFSDKSLESILETGTSCADVSREALR
jgi:hypothetical protein